ncbi:protoporphyrinogen oxidase HemJ [Rhizobium alvei]|uniref:Protoporphyrinogen IX oxidase n=1 Tax=Rhizobium alvei TaxID=1132659 RepID=A0ABT8YLV1_9HYPH|nr:protoporphyrinogen oxidase HemJ [Rhizobium alvei]MDO6964726.1 protoporphyrinogen oxidase HemJ [Rhizobium alvei]
MSESIEKSSSGGKAWRRAATAIAVFLLVAGSVFFLSDDVYSWFKAFHIMAVIAWMAGLFYLPRLFIYHFDVAPGSDASNLFKIMEQRLYRVIMNPSMMMAWAFGLYLAWTGFEMKGGWLHAKLLSVVLLTIVHVYYGRAAKAFNRDERPKSQRHWRIMNEAPAVLMIVIVLMVVLKPF